MEGGTALLAQAQDLLMPVRNLSCKNVKYLLNFFPDQLLRLRRENLLLINLLLNFRPLSFMGRRIWGISGNIWMDLLI